MELPRFRRKKGDLKNAGKTGKYRVSDLVGTPTDYANKSNWAHLPENTDKEVDTFFIYPTVYINPAPDLLFLFMEIFMKLDQQVRL